MNHKKYPVDFTQVLQRSGRTGIALTLGMIAFACHSTGMAQVVRADTPPDAAALARYDKNKDGTLDETERAAMLPSPPATAPVEEPVLQLSPFEVKADNRGYYAANVLSGTRLNSRLEDLGASVSVVTKQQMTDFGMLDLNDIFLYEAGTEGTGNYTDAAIDRFGNANDNVQDNPQGANRVRGLGPANMAVGNFATSGRVPVDPINIEAVEISRGPNSNIFGLGNASGTVNLVPSSANSQREISQVGLRTDSYGGYRGTLDLNRVLLKNRLALRGTFVEQHDGFIRKPSGTDSHRFTGMVKYQPFANTTIRGSFEYYHLTGARANAVVPRDAISYWKAAGSPTWDPVTYTAKLNGAAVGTFPTFGVVPAYFQDIGVRQRPSIFIDEAGVGVWMVNRTTNSADPSNVNQPIRFVESAPEPIRLNQPLYAAILPITDKSLYDWESVNTVALNTVEDTVRTSTIEIDQFIINTPRHLLAAQAGWRREDAERSARRTTGSDSGTTIYVDVNERLLDGRANPYFLRPYIGLAEPRYQENPLQTDIYRLQLAYKLTLSQEKGWLGWLGDHQFAAYGEYKETWRRQYMYRDAVISNHTWLTAGTARANLNIAPISPHVARGYLRYYVGDNVGQNMDYAPSSWDYGTYAFNWYNGVTRQWVTEQATIGRAATLDNSGGTDNLLNVLKSQGAVLQSHWLKGRAVTTFGLRDDQNYNQFGATPLLLPNGYEFDRATTDGWSGTWDLGEGRTKTAGIVVKPLRWLDLHFNKSDSFIPLPPAQTILRQVLPNTTGKGEDYGFTLKLWDGKLIVRANQYKNTQLNSRDGFGVGAIRVLRADFDIVQNDEFALNRQARAWIVADATRRGVTLSETEIVNEVARTMGLTVQDYNDLRALPFGETSDVTSRGREIEINYNPNRFWTSKLNVTQQRVVDNNLSPNLDKWLEQRMPVWTSIIDLRTGLPWFTSGYGSATNTPSAFLQANVIAPLRLAQANEGKSRTQVREYRANFSTNYRLEGLTDHRFWKRVNVGGALRWEDKGVIGYLGKQQPPAIVTEYDPERPVYDKARLYADVFVGYSTRLFSDKIGAKFNLNVRNVGENGGRLQAISVYPDGRGSNYRIIDPRQFILSVTFDL